MTTQQGKAERIRVAHKSLMEGYGYTDTVHALMSLYSVSDRTAKAYIEEARRNYVLVPTTFRKTPTWLTTGLKYSTKIK